MPRCNGCNAEIVWIQLDSMVKMPCDKDLKMVLVQYEDLPHWVRENLPSNIMKRGFLVPGRESHFASCPQADDFRGVRKKKKNQGKDVDALAEDADREMFGDEVQSFGLGSVGHK